jgi:hypothetical protein
MRRTPLFRALPILLAFASVTGCATAEALRAARESFGRSRAAGAEAKAPYEYYMAESYLERAEHESEEGDGAEARINAAKAANYSEEALRKAAGGAK